MSLNLDKRDKYVNPYYTNWFYLHNMTWLQMKLLEDMEWNGVYINNNLSDVPWTGNNRKYAERSVEYFINHLNAKIKEL